jgi:hypothetical protein
MHATNHISSSVLTIFATCNVMSDIESFYCYRFVTTFMQDIDMYVPETNHISWVYNVAAVLYLQFVLHEMLFRTSNIFCAFTLVISAVCVKRPIWLFF